MAYVEMIPCPLCKRLYHTEEGLRNHMQRAHDRELLSVEIVEIAEKEIPKKGSTIQEGQWVELLKPNGERLCIGFVLGAGVVSAHVELLGPDYTPYKPYKPLKEEIKIDHVKPLSGYLIQKDQEAARVMMIDLALLTGDREWFDTLTSKYM